MEENRQLKRESEAKLEEQRERQDGLASELAAARSASLPQCQDPLRLNITAREQFLAFAELRKNQEVVNTILEKSPGDGSEDFKALKGMATRNTQMLDLRLAAYQAAASSTSTMKAEFVSEYCRRLAHKLGAKDGKWGPSGEKKFYEIQGKVVNEVEKHLSSLAGGSGGGGSRNGGRGTFNARGAYNPGGGAHQGRGGGGGGRGRGRGGGVGGTNPAHD